MFTKKLINMNQFLEVNKIHCGYSEDLIKQIEPETVTCSIWSPPYHLNKEYEKDQTYDEWQLMLKEVILAHFPILKNGGFMIVNIANILCFQDETMSKIQMPNPSKHRVSLSKEEIVTVLTQHPKMNCYELAEYFGNWKKQLLIKIN